MKLIYGDALDHIQDFKDIDLVLTDPPYVITSNYGEVLKRLAKEWYNVNGC